MNALRRWLLINLAGGDSVVLNCTINVYQHGTTEDFAGIRGQPSEGTPVLQLHGDGLVYNNNFRVLSGQADRMTSE